MSITITKQTGNQKVEFIIEKHLYEIYITVYSNNKYITRGDLSLAADFKARNKNADLQAGAYGIVAACCPVSEATYNQLQHAIKEIQAEIDKDPALQMEKLIAKRESLIEHYNLLLACKHDQHIENIEDISAYGRSTKPQYDYDADLSAADEAIKEFDAAHPDVLNEIQIRKNNRINNFLAN